jgi:hypothetical protein
VELRLEDLSVVIDGRSLVRDLSLDGAEGFAEYVRGLQGLPATPP